MIRLHPVHGYGYMDVFIASAIEWRQSMGGVMLNMCLILMYLIRWYYTVTIHQLCKPYSAVVTASLINLIRCSNWNLIVSRRSMCVFFVETQDVAIKFNEIRIKAVVGLLVCLHMLEGVSLN